MSIAARLTSALLLVAVAAGGVPARAQEPARSHAYCAVEIGAKGVKGRVYVFGGTVQKNMPWLEPKFAKEINTNLVAGMEGKRYSGPGVAEAAAATATLMAEMKAQQPGCRPFIVASSGAGKGENRDELAKAVVEKTGIDAFEFITAEQEGRFAFFGSVPRRLWDSTTLVDIGSGNSKLGAVQGKDFRFIEIPFGAVTLTNRTTANSADFAQGAGSVLDAEARADFRKASSRYPIILNRRNTVLIGGTIWASVTYMLPDKGRRNFVKLTEKDLAEFRAALKNGKWTQNKPSPWVGGGVRAVFAEDSQKVLETFTRENLIAGHAVLEMYLDSRAMEGPIYFARAGNWIFGYVQEKFAQDIWGNENIEDHL
jgi:hypothetical protein